MLNYFSGMNLASEVKMKSKELLNQFIFKICIESHEVSLIFLQNKKVNQGNAYFEIW